MNAPDLYLRWLVTVFHCALHNEMHKLYSSYVLLAMEILYICTLLPGLSRIRSFKHNPFNIYL